MDPNIIYLTEGFLPVEADDPRMAMVKVRQPDGKVVFGVPAGVKQNTFEGHEGRPGKVGGSLPRGQGNPALADNERVWRGKETLGETTLTKLQTGEIGEKIAIEVLSEKFDSEFSTLNVGINNSPVDVAGDHRAVEVKTGMASNDRSGQRWRATIGQPGKKESALLKVMGTGDKKIWNERKNILILQRKKSMLQKMSRAAGSRINPMTVGLILSLDGKKADVFFIEGFHLSLRWSQYATDEYYVGTYNVK